MRARPTHVTPWPVSRLIDVLPESSLRGPGDTTFAGITLDNRAIETGDLFVALPGARTHGARFVPAAVAAGAAAVLTDAEGAALVPDGIPVVVIPTPRRVLAGLAAAFHEHPSTSFTTLGITGTQGKTTSTYLAEAARGIDATAVIGTIGTRIRGEAVRTELTTPEAPALQSLFAVMREEQVDLCAMEVSSHALVQGRVDGFVFDTAVFLNLGRDHLDFHDGMDDYFAAKAQLFTPEHARRAVINVDDPWGRQLVERTDLPVTTFSTLGAPADWRGVNVRPHRLGSDVTLLGPDGTETAMAVPLAGVFNVSNAVAVVAALAGVGHDPVDLAAGIGRSTGVPGRMERVECGQEATVVVDYAHKPEAVTAVLSALRPVTAGRLIILLGAGGDRDHGKRPLMGEAAAALADVVVVTDDNPRSENPAAIRAAIIEGARSADAVVHEIGDRREAIAWALSTAGRGDTVIIAGKGHETGQEIAGTVHPFDDRTVVAEELGR